MSLAIHIRSLLVMKTIHILLTISNNKQKRPITPFSLVTEGGGEGEGRRDERVTFVICNDNNAVHNDR